jgi:hypothetical protein
LVKKLQCKVLLKLLIQDINNMSEKEIKLRVIFRGVTRRVIRYDDRNLLNMRIFLESRGINPGGILRDVRQELNKDYYSNFYIRKITIKANVYTSKGGSAVIGKEIVKAIEKKSRKNWGIIEISQVAEKIGRNFMILPVI